MRYGGLAHGWPICAILLALFATPPAAAQEPYRLATVPAGVRPVVDGLLGEWDLGRHPEIRIESAAQVVVARDGRWNGPDDVSGRIRFAIDRTALYVFGHVRDDVVRGPPHPGAYNGGDAIEIFIDTDRADDDGPPRYSEDDFQLFLWPGATGVASWGALRAGAWIEGPGAVVGIETAFRDEDGGYAFEARIPLVNFPRLADVADGTVLALNIALGDREIVTAGARSLDKYVYLTWNGEADLWMRPDRFVEVRVADPDGVLAPPPIAPLGSGLWPLVAGTIGALLIGAVGFTIVVRWIAGWRAATRLRLAIAGIVALAGIAALGAVMRRVSDRLVVDRVDQAAGVVREVVDATRARVRTAPLVELLRGGTGAAAIETPLEYRHLPVGSPETFAATELGAQAPAPATRPRYAGQPLPLDVGVNTRLRLVRGDPTDFIAVLVSVWRRSGIDAALQPPGAAVASLRLMPTDGDGAIAAALDFDEQYELVPGGRDASLVSTRRVAVRSVLGVDATTWEIVVDARRLADRPFDVSIDANPAWQLRVHGLSGSGRAGWRAIPVRLTAPFGPPLAIVQHNDPTTVSTETATTPSVRVGERFDRLWVFFVCRNGYPDGSPRGTRVADVVVRYRDGTEQREALHAGEHLEDHRRFRVRHTARMRSQVATNDLWDARGDRLARSRVDGLAIGVQAAVIDSVHLEWNADCDGPEQIELVAVTGGIAREAPALRRPTDALIVPVARAASVALSTDAAAALRRVDVARAVVPAGAARAAQLEGDDAAAYVPIDHDHGVRVAAPLVRRPHIEGATRWASLVLIGALLPLILVLLADAVGQGRRVRRKLLVTIGLTTLPPLALLVLYLDREISDHIERKVRARARSATDIVVRDVRAEQARVDAFAREAAQDPTLIRQLAETAPTAFTERLGSLVGRLATNADEEDTTLLVWDRALGRAATPESPERPHPRRLAAIDRSGLVRDRGRVLHVGHAPIPGTRETGRWVLIAIRPVAPAMIERLFTDDAETRAFAFLPTPGYPVAGFPRGDVAFTLQGARRARIAALRAMADDRLLLDYPIGDAPTTAGVRVLLDGMEEPALAVGAAIDRGRAFALRDSVRRSALFFVAALMTLFVAITFLVAQRFVRPIERLSDAARALATGRSRGERVPIDAPDEIGDLTSAFNEMSAQMLRRLDGLELLNRGMRDVGAPHTVDAIVAHAIDVLDDALAPAGIAVVLHDPDRGVFRIVGGRRNGRPVPEGELPATDGFFDRAMRHGAPLRIRAFRWLSLERRESAALRLGNERPDVVVTLPLDVQEDLVGLIVLSFRAGEADDGRIDDDNLLVLGALGRQIASALDTARLYQLAIADPTTGFYLPTYFDVRLREELQRASRHDRTLALVLLDVEEPAIVERNAGADAVARLHRELAARLRKVFATVDGGFATRLDVRRFAFAIPDGTAAAGADLAARCAAAVRARPFAGPSAPLEIVPRVASVAFPDDAGSAEFLLSEAESRLGIADPAAERPAPAGHAPFADPTLVLRNPHTLALVDAIRRLRATDATVLITGETGTGKELFAELVHRLSDRAEKPLVRVNCAALPEPLLESELFGHERGAFTGAHQRKIGRFERAHRGTLFLDEIGEIPPATQVKLLRVLQDKRIERIGGTKSIDLDVRIVAATNRDLAALVREGRFREDLYYRLLVIHLEVPPLRDRRDEIPVLVERFVADFNQEHGDRIAGVSPEALDALGSHPWPGNIRELKNVLDRAMLDVDPGDGWIRASHLRFQPATEPATVPRAPSPTPLAPATPRPTPPQSALPESANHRHQELIRYLTTHESITNQTYHAMVDVSPRTGLRDLNELIEAGVLERVGSRRGARYRLRKRS